MAAVQTLSPPPTLNHLPALQRARLLRSTRKLGAVLGAQPVLLEVADPYEVRPSRERADLNELLPIGPLHTRSKSLSPAPIPSPTKAGLAPATQKPVRQGRSAHRDNSFLNLAPSRSLRDPRSFSASARNRKIRADAPQPLILSVQPVEVDPTDPRLLEGGSSKSPLQPSTAGNSPSPPRRANTPRKFSHASRASSSSALTVSSSPVSTPLTPSFRFLAPEIPAERRRKMARLARVLGENVPPELVFPAHRNHLESFWEDGKKLATLKSEKNSDEGRGSSEWLLVGSKNAGEYEEDMGIPPSASPPRKLAHLRARSASPNLPSSASPFSVVFPPFDINPSSNASLDSRRPSEAEVALATIPSATPSTPTPPEKSFRASNPDVPMDVEAEPTPTTKTLLSIPSPASSPSKGATRHKRRSASLSSLARPLQMHLKLGTGGGAWQAPAEWAVGPSPPASPTPVSRAGGKLMIKGRGGLPATAKTAMASADDLDAYVPRAASLDSVISPPRGVRLGRTGGAGVPAYARTQNETKTKVWAEVSTGLDVLPPEQAAYTINKEREERERERERMKKRRGYLEVLDQLRSLRH